MHNTNVKSTLLQEQMASTYRCEHPFRRLGHELRKVFKSQPPRCQRNRRIAIHKYVVSDPSLFNNGLSSFSLARRNARSRLNPPQPCVARRVEQCLYAQSHSAKHRARTSRPGPRSADSQTQSVFAVCSNYLTRNTSAKPSKLSRGNVRSQDIAPPAGGPSICTKLKPQPHWLFHRRSQRLNM